MSSPPAVLLQSGGQNHPLWRYQVSCMKWLLERLCHSLQHSVPSLCPTLYQMDFRGTWQLSVCLTSVSNHVHQGSPGKRPWKRVKVSCKLVKHLVTSHLVHVETEGCNRLLRRGCAVFKLSVKEVVGMREEILLSGGHVSQSAVPEQTSD